MPSLGVSDSGPNTFDLSSTYKFPNFLEGQRESFKKFLTQGLKHELIRYGFISVRYEDLEDEWVYFNEDGRVMSLPLDGVCDIIIHGEQYKLTKPRLTPQQAILKRQTYSSQLFVPIQFIYHPTKEVFIDWFLLANLPMMTQRGHFIVNGSPRLVMNQITRAPGIYFKKVDKLNQHAVYVADIIAHRGTWLRLEMDNKANRRIWAKVKRWAKFPINLALASFDISPTYFDRFLNQTKYWDNFSEEPIFENTFFPRTEAVSDLFRESMYKETAGVFARRWFFWQKFNDPRYYDLSPIGRQRLNKQLGIQVPTSKTVLTGEDVVLGCCRLIEFSEGNLQESDIDDLINRKIKSSGELVQIQMGIGLLQLHKDIRGKMNQKPDLKGHFWKNRDLKKLKPKNLYKQKKAYFRGLIKTAPINQTLKTFFGTNPLCQFLDQINPLAELTHKRRTSALGDGGVNRENASMAIRGIHPSHYGRICPIETSEGQNAGLVKSYTTYARVNQWGAIETPFYPIHKGVVLKTEPPYFFGPDQEQNFVLAPGDISLDYFNYCSPQLASIRESQQLFDYEPDQFEWASTGPLQMISVAPCLVPFVEHNDGNRALMGANMQRQAVPTLIPQRPIVGTGLEPKIIAQSGYGIQAQASGLVTYVDNNSIILYISDESSANDKSLPLSFFDSTIKSPNFVKPINCHNSVMKKVDQKKKYMSSQEKQVKNSLLLNAQQLNQTLALNMDNELLSLKTLFSVLSKQLACSQSSGLSPVIGSKTLDLFEQTLNEAFICQYCILLLSQFNWLPNDSPSLIYNKKPTNKPVKRQSIFLASPSWKKRLTIKHDALVEVNGATQELVPVLPYLMKSFSQPKNINFLLKKRQPQKSEIILPSVSKHSIIRLLTLFQNKQQPIECDIETEYAIPYRHKDLFKVKTNVVSKLNQFDKRFNKPIDRLLVDERFQLKAPSISNAQKLTLRLFTKQLQFTYPRKLLPYSKPSEIRTKVKPSQYELEGFSRSNQDTVMGHSPVVSPGQWVEKGDLLADNRASDQGRLAVGQNLLVGYTPWDGYNFEDAVLMSQKAISEDLFTTLHIERYELLIKDTQYGREQLTRKPPSNQNALPYLDEDGTIINGTWVNEGDVLVGKITPIEVQPLAPYERLLYDILERAPDTVRDSSLRVPTNVHGRVVHVEKLYGELLPNETKNLPNVENSDAKQETPKQMGKKQVKFHELIKYELLRNNGKLTAFQPKRNRFDYKKLAGQSQPLSFTLDSENDVTKKSPFFNTHLFSHPLRREKKRFLFDKKEKKRPFQTVEIGEDQNPSLRQLVKIYVYIAEQRKIQVGDKIAGRHGNKGIISGIVPREDMPYLPDGTMLDLVLNPLGVPSRMNVGQIFECLLGFAGHYLNQTYTIEPFDEAKGPETSRGIVYSKLYEACLKTGQSWLFDPDAPGKVTLFDGRTGDCFEQPVTVGKAYIIKLIHLVDEKIHARATGPYSLVTQQPLRGRSSQGGQRVGEMEVWAFEGFGAAYILQELLTIKSDDIYHRQNVPLNILKNKPFQFGRPESFTLLVNELQSLCLKVLVKAFPIHYVEHGSLYKVKQLANVYGSDKMNFSKTILWPFTKGINPYKQRVPKKKVSKKKDKIKRAKQTRQSIKEKYQKSKKTKPVKNKPNKRKAKKILVNPD